ncbi:uncharacterized protein LOC143600791 [Bidens hawaiensis]|uniref:uncharacterized protein LOC143600791 n=1 Tax=Bidens hawaiensis TaxID=980011 RepID=UPI00404B231A
MASAGYGTAPNEPAGAGGKFRKKPLRRSIPATPYSRPPTAVRNNNPSMFKKLVDPASRLIYAGTHRLFDVFRRSLPPRSLGPTEVNEDPQNVLQNEGEDGNAASNAAATGISELEQMLQQKTFTRSEIQRLTSVLHSKTTESPFDDSQEKHGEKRVTFHAAISTPIVTSGVLKEEIASPAELAKSYMGSRPTNQEPRQDSKLLPRTPFTPVAQKTTNSLRNLENGFATPRSRGRSAMYTMARSPYFKSPSISSQQGIKSDYAHDAALTSFQGQEGRTALKRRSSVLDDDIGSGNSLRRIRQKANLISQREKKELGYTGFQQPDGVGQTLLLADKYEPTVSNYASVPAKATQTATKILQLCDKPSPKENNSVSTNELRLDMLHGQALKSLEKVESPKFVSSVNDIQKPVVPELIFKSKDKTEESSVRKSPVSNNMFTSVNGDVRDTLKDKAPVAEPTELPSKVTEVVQIKHAFQMSAPEDSFEMDDEDDVEYNKPVFDEVSKVPEQIKLKEGENDTNKGSVSDQGLGFKIPVSFSSSPPVTITQSSVFTKSTSQVEKVDPVKVSPFLFAANEVSEFKPNASSDAKAKEVVPISVFNSVAKKDAAKVSVSNKDENGVLNGKSVSLFPAASAATSSDGIFSFGTSTKNISTPDTTPASNPPTFPSLATFSASASTAATLSTTTTTTTTTPAVTFSTSVSPQGFSFGSAASTAPSTSVAGTGNTTTSSSSPFAITTFATTTTTESGLFGFSSPATATSTTNTTAGSGFFGFSSPAATTAAAGSGLFGSSSSAAATSTTTTTTTGSGLFGVGSPAATATGSGLFGASSLTAATTTGSGLFGASSSAAATTGSGLFGASSSAAATTTGSGLFGASFPAATTSTNGSGPFGFSSAAAATSTTAATTGNGLFGFSSPAATTSTANTSTASGLFGFSSSAGPTSTTTASTAGGLFGFSSPAPPTLTATTTTGSGLFGASSSTAATSTTTPFGFGSAAAATSTATPFGFGSSAAATSTTTPSPFGFSSTAAATSTTMATTGGVPFAFNSSAAAPSTTSSQSPGSFFNISNGFQASANASSTGTLFGSSAPAIGSSTFGTSSLGPTSETKSGNTTSIFGSTWQQPQTSSAFGLTFTSPSSSVFSFGASSTPAPSFMTAGASNSSFGGPSVFGNSTPVFGAVNNNNNNNNSDQMSMEDSMAEDSMQTHSPVSPFGQAPASSPGFMFGSATPTPAPAPAPVSFSFGGQPNQAPPPQNPFQSSSVEFNAGGGSFSLGSGGDKSNRRIVRVMKGKNRKK